VPSGEYMRVLFGLTQGVQNGPLIAPASAAVRLRGPQHDCAWCDELAAWRYPEAWDMLMFGLRLGENPQVMVTTTPRPTKLLKDLVADPSPNTSPPSKRARARAREGQ
jgi:phage terminase large subunit-like protein